MCPCVCLISPMSCDLLVVQHLEFLHDILSAATNGLFVKEEALVPCQFGEA